MGVSDPPLPPGLPTQQPPASHVRAVSPRPARQGSALGNEYEHDPPAADGSGPAGLEILNSWAQDTSGRLKFLLLSRKEPEQERPGNSRTGRGLMRGGAAEGPRPSPQGHKEAPLGALSRNKGTHSCRSPLPPMAIHAHTALGSPPWQGPPPGHVAGPFPGPPAPAATDKRAGAGARYLSFGGTRPLTLLCPRKDPPSETKQDRGLAQGDHQGP